jgi:glycosyltransferase involved in cell wall biosynthesis
MLEMPLSISVFVPLYNHEKFIQATLRSAINQTIPPDEVVVIDDGSTDRSSTAAKSVLHSSIRLFEEESNLGGAATMLGLSRCQGDAVAILNSDDTWEADKLKRQVDYLATAPNCGVVFTLVNLIDEEGKAWSDGTNRHMSRFEINNKDRTAWLRHFFHFGNVFCASSAMVRKKCFEEVGLLDGRYIQLQDFDMWLRIALAGYDIHLIEERLTNYRLARNGANMSFGSARNQAVYTIEYARLLRNYWKIRSLNELIEIFPEIKIANHADDSLILFYLARHAAAQQTLHHRLFAIETMEQWGGNIEAKRLAASCEGFSHVDYQNFIAQWPNREAMLFSFRLKMLDLSNKVLRYDLQQRLKTLLLQQ